MPTNHPRTVGRLAVSALMVATMALGACGTDDGDAADSGPTTTAPEQKVSSDADVAAGLAKMRASLDELIAAGSDAAKAGAANDELEPVWKDIEGTIKTNEPDVYITIEDAMSELSAGVEGDEEKGALGITDLTSAIDEYLAKYPG